MRFLHIFLLALSLLSLSGCAPMHTAAPFRDNLANRGPVALSASNPYIASNILLSKEVESSSTLRGFLKVRGNPEAVEIKKVLLRPYMMYFFYPRSREVYILEESNSEWIIRGPQTIPGDVLSVIEQVVPADLATSAVPEPEKTASSEVELGSSSVSSERPSEIPEQTDLMPAKTAPSHFPGKKGVEKVEGDIIHTVQFRGETLRLIAEWYGGAADVAPRIARINGLKDANNLTIGQDIRIPRYLAKNSRRLPKSAVEKYRATHKY